MTQSGYLPMLWRLWPVLGWGLPLAFALTQFWTVAEVPELGLILAAVILVGGALGMLPRRILRTRGQAAVPGAMAPVLLVLWWSWATLLIIHVTTSVRIFSVITVLEPLGRPVHEYLAMRISGWMVCLLVVALLILITQGSVLPAASRSDLQQRSLRWHRIAIAVLGGFPVLVIGSGITAQWWVEQQPDAAGDSVRTAQGRSPEARVELVQQRYQAAQQELSEVRQILAPASLWYDAQVYIDRAASVDRTGAESYEFLLDYELDAVVGAATTQAAVAHLERDGWHLVDAAIAEQPNEFWVTREDGRRIRFFGAMNGDVMSIDYTSASWWTGDDHGALGVACPTAGLSDFFTSSEGLREGHPGAAPRSDASDVAGERDQTHETEEIRYSGLAWPECSA